MGKTKLEDYQNAISRNLAHDPNEKMKLSKIEQAILERHLLMKIKAKTGKWVSCLVPMGNVKKALDSLVNYRSRFVQDNNPYLFANRGKGYRKIWPTIKKSATRYGCSNPSAIKSTSLRKHLATSIQML